MPAFKQFNRVKETCSAPGTGTVTLLGAPTGFRAFGSKLANGERSPVFIVDQLNANWELGLHVWNTGGTITRSAGDVLDGSAGAGVLVNFASGTQDVFLGRPAEFDNVPYITPAVRQVVAASFV
jgi:hypothetical protein